MAADEAFDITVLTWIETDLLLLVGKSYVSDACIKKLVEIIDSGSRMYLPRLERNGTSEEPRINSALSLKIGVTSSYGLGMDIVPLGREEFALSCLSLMFSLCSDGEQSRTQNSHVEEVEIRKRIACVAVPHLLERVRGAIRSYAADRPVFGKCPLPRIRNEELLFILDRLEKLHLIKSILPLPDTKRTLRLLIVDELQKVILSGSCAMLFSLYRNLCDLLAAVTRVEATSVDSDEGKITDSVRLCLSRIGFELGLESI